MARHDYHVLAYRLLAYLYECLKHGRAVDADAISAEALGIEHGYWLYILRHLRQGGYVEGGCVSETLGDGAALRTDLLEITPDGIEYLQQNTTMAKARDFLRTLKETIPGL